MAKIANVDRAASDISTLVHENYVNEVKPWLDHISPLAGLFNSLGDGGYSLVGEKIQFARDYTYRGGFMGTDGYLPEPEAVDPLELQFTPARLYARSAVDNFLAASAVRPGAYEEFSARLMTQMWDAVERGTTRHIHGGSDATVCTFSSRTSATVLVVDAGYGYAGASPAMFLEPGMTLALLDASSSYATIGVAKIDSIDYDTSATTATITFASDIDTSSTGADGDPLVFATTNDSSDSHFVTERNNAPLGLLDIIDPNDDLTAYGGLTESSWQRINPIRRASSDFGHIEIMEFLAEIEAKSNSPVSAQSHVLTMQKGAEIELAKELLGFQQQAELGRTLQGGWQAVRIGQFDVLSDPYHIPDVVYALAPEDLFVVDLDGEPEVWAGDGSPFQRLTDYDGKEWFIRHYVNRFAGRRNNMGALTGVSNPNKQRYAAVPEST